MASVPVKLARQLRRPALLCVCDSGTVAPTRPTFRHVRRAPRGEVKLDRGGHFDLYIGQGFEKVVADHIDSLRRHDPIR